MRAFKKSLRFLTDSAKDPLKWLALLLAIVAILTMVNERFKQQFELILTVGAVICGALYILRHNRHS